MNQLEVGDPAPGFLLKNHRDETVELAAMRGRTVILYFYPKALTPGCTVQACGMRDAQSELADRNAVAFGVSPDPVDKLRKFVDKHQLSFDLLSDGSHEVAEKYGVWALKKFMGREFWGVLRKTFVIDEQGKIIHVMHKVNTKSHQRDVLAWLSDSGR